MRFITGLLIISVLGCASLNTPREPNVACSDKPHACGCCHKDVAMDGCMKNADGSTCCSKDECRCKEVTQR
jgi:hypothetical protein